MGLERARVDEARHHEPFSEERVFAERARSLFTRRPEMVKVMANGNEDHPMISMSTEGTLVKKYPIIPNWLVHPKHVEIMWTFEGKGVPNISQLRLRMTDGRQQLTYAVKIERDNPIARAILEQPTLSPEPQAGEQNHVITYIEEPESTMSLGKAIAVLMLVEHTNFPPAYNFETYKSLSEGSLLNFFNTATDSYQISRPPVDAHHE